MKTMKLRNILIATLCALTFTGCEKWLDVRPRTEVKELDIYTTEIGFKEVMNGVYITAASKELYGLYASMYFNDMLARLWTVGSSAKSRDIALSKWDYTNADVATLISDIWFKYYSAIGDINNLIDNLEKTDVRFAHGNKELLMGEAYGLRAFLHFDVLRMFGPVPAGATDDMNAIPYVTELTREPGKLLSKNYGEVKRMILEDLEKAEEYLANDPFTKGSMRDLNRPNSDDVTYIPDDSWHYYRQTHFNIYAIDALRARYYLWIGQPDKAMEMARKVIDAKNEDGSPKFELTTEANTYTKSSERNLVMRCEQIFALHCSNHQQILDKYMTGTNPRLVSTTKEVDIMFETRLNPSDSRNATNRYWQSNITNDMQYYKYLGSGLIPTINMVPLMRLSEMYLILIENLPLTEAQEVFNVYRQAKSMSTDTRIQNESKRKSQVMKEYMKEFFAEGQMFYYYKRTNTARIDIPTRFIPPTGGYVIPVPDSQKMFE